MIWCFAEELCTRGDAGMGVLLWWSCQSSVAHSCSLLNHPNSFHRGMFKLNVKFDADSLFYSLSHFECDGHTVHMLTQQHLPPPLTSTVKSSLFTHAHSSPLSLAARLHRCRATILTIAGHFPDRLYICLQIHMVKLSINFATLCDFHTILNIKNITPVWD